ncbi:MAG TPA: hypothetical protein VHY84_13705 [Bryobacteraceae bacterium]|jgi:hypothetical protein|nr:hypothetical protein [Bryobacteraceae bacterium]
MAKLVLALFAVAFVPLAQSQPPSQTPVARGGAQQEKRDTKQQSSERGNQPANPRPAAVDQSAANTERAKIQQQGTPASPNSSSQPVVVNVNIPKSDFNWTDLLIAIFTGLLVGVGALQWDVLKSHHAEMHRQAGYIEGLLTQTKTAAEAAKSSAETAALQRQAMDKQTDLMKGQVDLMSEQLNAAMKTLEEVKRQADLMAVPYQTWVDYGKWDSSCRRFEDGPYKFVIFFVVANRTQFPVTLKDAFVEFLPEGRGMAGKRFNFRPDYRLLPGREPVDSMAWDIAKADFAGWESGDLTFTVQINGDLNHTGPLGPCPKEERRFYGTLRCNKRLTIFEEKTLMRADQQQS